MAQKSELVKQKLNIVVFVVVYVHRRQCICQLSLLCSKIICTANSPVLDLLSEFQYC